MYLKPIYFPLSCNIDTELFLPVAKHANSYQCLVAYFTVGGLSELASSIYAYLQSSNNATMQLVINPFLPQKEINELITIHQANEEYSFMFHENYFTEDLLRNETMKALAYLIVTKKIEFRIAVMKTGIFHPKVWLFETILGDICIHGSSNATSGGLHNNFEQLAVSCSWEDARSTELCQSMKNLFHTIWFNQRPELYVFPLNLKTIENLKSIIETDFTLDFFIKYYENCLNSKLTPEDQVDVLHARELIIPKYLNYTDGEYKHQGLAIQSWFENHSKGILSIATGGGKTLTSLIATSLLNKETGPLLVVIAVPTVILLQQWLQEIELFKMSPCHDISESKSSFLKSFKMALRQLKNDTSRIEIILITHKRIQDDNFISLFNKLNPNIKTLLIADEVHNLGSPGFIQISDQLNFDYTLGLSATFERQYDENGSQFLLNYFGPVIYEFTLNDAIGKCLVPYEYNVHLCYLNEDEQEEFLILSNKISRLFAMNPDGDDDDKLSSLLIQRRRLIEVAADKIHCFNKVFLNELNPSNVLIFCTDKDPEQLSSINEILNNRHITFHQITAAETSNRKELGELLDLFGNGQISVLTSKKVLDEGFNIPQIEKAYFLASNTVNRQWIQRLGRVLRLSPKTNKTKAVIHDFVVLPDLTNCIDKDLKKILKSEYNRIAFFNSFSSNQDIKNLEVMDEFIKLMDAI